MVAGLTQLWTLGNVNIYLPGELCGLIAARLAGWGVGGIGGGEVTSDPLTGSSQEHIHASCYKPGKTPMTKEL